MNKITLAKYSKDPHILETLSRDEDWLVRYWVAGNPNTPIPILQTLSRDEHWNVRCWVAGNPNTPIPILEALSKDKDSSFVRQAVAQNQNIPVSILKCLLYDCSDFVAESATTNKNMRIEPLLFSKIAASDRTNLILAMIENEFIPVELLQKLLNHKSDIVKRNASRELSKRNQAI
jgi:hypothetical protein